MVRKSGEAGSHEVAGGRGRREVEGRDERCGEGELHEGNGEDLDHVWADIKRAVINKQQGWQVCEREVLRRAISA